MVAYGKLGCLPPKPQQRARLLKVSKYVSSSQLPAPPAKTDWRAAVSAWGMLGNDTVGDCTEACTGHALLAWAANGKVPLVVPEGAGEVTIANAEQQLTPMVLSAYSRVSGYNGTPWTDRGAAIIDVLNDWRANGVAGNKLGAFLSVEPTNHASVVESLYLFGGASCGVSLPLAWQGASVWSAPSRAHRWGRNAPGSWGGHCVLAIDFDASYLYVVSWGQVVPVTWAAVDMYFDEFYALLDNLWVDGSRAAPNGFDLATLQQDLQAITA
jgi:hypothetical protein